MLRKSKGSSRINFLEIEYGRAVKCIIFSRKTLRVIFLFAFFLFKFVNIWAQSEPINCDRPGFTTTGITLPQKHIQIETGLMFEDNHDHLNIPFFSSLIRFGIIDRFELRLAFEPMLSTPLPKAFRENDLGLNYLKAGFKWHLLKEKGIIPDIFLLANSSLPILENLTKQPYSLSPDLVFGFSHTITPFISLGYNFSIKLDDKFNASYQYATAMSFFVTEKTDFFMEFYGDFSSKLNAFDCGFAYRFRNNMQFDIYAGKGLSAISYDFFIAAGYSYRLPK